MNFDIETFDFIDRYFLGGLNNEELKQFNERIESDSLFAKEVATQKELIELMDLHDQKSKLIEKLNFIHDDIDIDKVKEDFRQPSFMKRYDKRNILTTVLAAASVSIIVVFSTLYFTGWFNYQKQVTSYMELKNNLAHISSKQQSLWNAIFSNKKTATPSGTCFSVSSNGYLVTNYHVVKDVDSISVVNYMDSVIKFNARLVYKDEKHDLAILKIDDKNLKSFGMLPYTIKKDFSDLGENVFTLGYSKNDLVYGEGFISSSTGFNEDSSAYQVSIPVNPGNSGSPLLDAKGELIGIISGKHSQDEGATFAVKSNYLLIALDSVKADKSLKAPIMTKKNDITGYKRITQIKKLHSYIFKVEVYK